MKQLKRTLKISFLIQICFWSVGCQQLAPPQFSRRMTGQSQVTQTQSNTPNYSNLFSNNSNQSSNPPANPNPPAAQPQVTPTSCSTYTVPAQTMLSACKPVLQQYQEDLYDIAPSCLEGFNQITPNTGCDTLVPQLETMFRNCRTVLSTYGSYLGAACQSAYMALLR